MKTLLGALLLSAAFVATPARAASDVVTIYSADGLHDGKGSWFETEFNAFTKATGVKVQYIEGGSGGVVERVAKEKSNPQADVLVTLPPFIQRAEAEGLLQKFTPEAASVIAGGDDNYQPLVNNYMNFIYNAATLTEAPKSYADLLDAKFKGKIQYSTPGQAGDGTAVMLQVIHSFGGRDAAFDYLKKLQDNNVGPSASTGKLTALVNKSELYVANGDLQMNMSQMSDNPNIRVFWPAGPNGERSAMPLPYYVGARRRRARFRQRQEAYRISSEQGCASFRVVARDRRTRPQGRDPHRRQLCQTARDDEGRDVVVARLGRRC